jgi:uncharacterized lipoprotein NlpE involved in copper resistance
MKSKMVFVLIVLLVFGLVLVGCDNGTTDTTKFEGTWENITDEGTISYIFSGSNYTGAKSWDSEDSFSGTFTFTETTITFSFGDDSWTQNYTLFGDTLTLDATGDRFNGTFTKKN